MELLRVCQIIFQEDCHEQHEVMCVGMAFSEKSPYDSMSVHLLKEPLVCRYIQRLCL